MNKKSKAVSKALSKVWKVCEILILFTFVFFSRKPPLYAIRSATSLVILGDAGTRVQHRGESAGGQEGQPPLPEAPTTPYWRHSSQASSIKGNIFCGTKGGFSVSDPRGDTFAIRPHQSHFGLTQFSRTQASITWVASSRKFCLSTPCQLGCVRALANPHVIRGLH